MHLVGRIANVAAGEKFTISYNIVVIEDGTQALVLRLVKKMIWYF